MRIAITALLLCTALHAETLFENDQVKVIRALDTPHKMGARHQHAVDRVMIYLDSGDIQLKYDDGHADNQHWKAGDIAWSPKGQFHTSENVGYSTIHIIEVELKNRSDAKSFRVSPMDPVKLQPKAYKLVFEHPNARVYTADYAPGHKDVMHEHAANMVVVAMNDGKLRITTSDGKSSEVDVKTGDAIWAAPATHRTDNIGGKPLRFVIVEPKN